MPLCPLEPWSCLNGLREQVDGVLVLPALDVWQDPEGRATSWCPVLPGYGMGKTQRGSLAPQQAHRGPVQSLDTADSGPWGPLGQDPAVDCGDNEKVAHHVCCVVRALSAASNPMAVGRNQFSSLLRTDMQT